MAINMKSYQRIAEACERRWKTAMKEGNTGEAYTALQDYQNNIQEQEKKLKEMNPNSKEYEQAYESILSQKANAFEMRNEERLETPSEQKRQTYEELDYKNDQISREMGKAIERGDTATYDSLRTQYEKNLATQELLGQEMKEEHINFEDNVRTGKYDILNKDIDMRNKMAEKITSRESKGKSISEEDKAKMDKYVNQVKNDEKELVHYDNNKKIEHMRDRGASEEAIKSQEEQNQHEEKWVNEINEIKR